MATQKFTVEIKRFNPEVDKEAHWETYSVEADLMDRVLDVLNYIKWHIDGTLTYRRSCAHAVCGSDAMQINGLNKLACATLMKEFAKSGKVTIAPLPGLPVVKDLVVDQSEFWKKYEAISPFLINNDPAPELERLQSAEEHALIEESTKCILCGACTQSCPSTWSNPEYLGPAAMLKAYRFIFDSRDQGASQRLKVLDSSQGLWKCYTVFNCVAACPKEIDITKHLSALKRKALTANL